MRDLTDDCLNKNKDDKVPAFTLVTVGAGISGVTCADIAPWIAGAHAVFTWVRRTVVDFCKTQIKGLHKFKISDIILFVMPLQRRKRNHNIIHIIIHLVVGFCKSLYQPLLTLHTD